MQVLQSQDFVLSGHLDSRTSIRRVLMCTSFFAFVYSIIQVCERAGFSFGVSISLASEPWLSSPSDEDEELVFLPVHVKVVDVALDVLVKNSFPPWPVRLLYDNIEVFWFTLNLFFCRMCLFNH